MNMKPIETAAASGLISLQAWLEQVGISPITAWRWRKKGMLRTVNICGRPYLTAEAIEEFKRRAETGEFAVQRSAPPKKKSHDC